MADSDEKAAHWLPAARTGSVEALGQLLEACRGYLLMIAQSELDPALQAKGGASDLVQNTLLEAVQNFSHFQGGTESELLQWLRRLLLNNLVDFARQYRQAGKRQVDKEVALEGNGSGPTKDIAADSSTPSGKALASEQLHSVQNALEKLPENYRHIIFLRYQEERSFEEIGHLLVLTPNAARKLLLRAVERLRHELGELP